MTVFKLWHWVSYFVMSVVRIGIGSRDWVAWEVEFIEGVIYAPLYRSKSLRYSEMSL